MKTKILLAMISILNILCLFPQPRSVRAISILINLPDLVFGKSQMLRGGSVEVSIINKGKAKSAASEGSFGCGFTADKNGTSFGSGSVFIVNELAPNETQKVVLDCGKKGKLLGAFVDWKNKVTESNEKNNTIKF